MKNIYEVLRQKETELSRLTKEIEALHIAIRLLADDSDAQPEATPKLIAVAEGSTPAGVRPLQPALVKEGGHSAAWENAPAPRPFP
ncbi:MAG: hypothetical protein ACE14M_09010 [Terriglobales bacterium]